MISTSKDNKSKLFEKFKKYRFVKNTAGAKRPDHEMSDDDSRSEQSSSSRSTPSKHSNPVKVNSNEICGSSSHKPGSKTSQQDNVGGYCDGESVFRSRIVNRKQLENSSDDEDVPKRAFSRIMAVVSNKKRKRIQAPSSSSDSEIGSQSSCGSTEPGKRRALNRNRRSPVIERKKRKNKEENSGGERWSDTVLVDSEEDDLDGVRTQNEMTSTKQRVFQFMNFADKDELMLVNLLTAKKAETIIENRPFKGWADLIVKFRNGRSLTVDLLDSALSLLKCKDIVSRLMKKCLELAVSTEKAILEGASTLTSQPSILNDEMQLKSYQMVGLNWLVVMHNQKLNGILADEMGLGKTIQVLSFIAYLRETGITKGPHLIVCPTSTIDNWAIEFTKWCPDIEVTVYHGSQDERKSMRCQWFRDKFKSIDVIITSYQIVGSNAEERKMFKIMPIEYVVFDEAHMLKNMNTQRYSNLFSINAKSRLLLTGTPLQNNLLELMSLLNFVMPSIFSSKIIFIRNFFARRSKPSSGSDSPDFEREQVELAKRIMNPFVMRRLKQDVLKDLPKKTNLLLSTPLSVPQKIKYDCLLKEIREAASATDDQSPSNFMSSFMQLRKLSNHPLTLRYNYEESTIKEMASRLAADYGYKETKEENIFEDLCFSSDHEIHKIAKEYKSVAKFKLNDSLLTDSGKFHKLDELLPKLKEDGHRVVLFSQFVFMLDIIEDYLRINKHEFLRLDGSTSMGDRQELIDDFNEDNDIFVFLLTTKAGGVGINLTSADTVIIHDVDFNPYNDKQAEDRCHRLGQTRPVQVIRFISEDTVEEKIYAMAQSKLNLEQELIGGDEESENVKKVESLLKEVLGFVKKK